MDIYATKFNRPNIQISGEVFEILRKYDFPGNVRELRNMTERAIILSKTSRLEVSDFPMKTPKPELTAADDELINLRTNEVAMVRKALKNCNYNQSAAADILGITRDALIRKMKKYDISVSKNEE